MVGVLAAPAALGDDTAVGAALAAETGEQLAAGADVIELRGLSDAAATAALVARLVDLHAAPVVVNTCNPVVLAAALDAGAVGGADPSGCAHPDYLPVSVDRGALAVVGSVWPAHRLSGVNGGDHVDTVAAWLAGRAQLALDAGLSPRRLVLDDMVGCATVDAALAVLRVRSSLAGLGIPLAVSFPWTPVSAPVPVGQPAPAAVLAAQSLGIANGRRWIRTRDVAATRRVADVLAAILATRDDAGSTAEEQQ